MLKQIKKDESGQALLFVVVALTIATVLGVSVSTRTLSSVRRTTTTDTSTKALYAAEAGIEKYLFADDSRLEDILTDVSNACIPGDTQDTATNTCSFTLGTGPITTNTQVTIDRFRYTQDTPSEKYFESTLNNGGTMVTNLAGYTGSTVQVCFGSQGNALPGIAYTLYNSTDVVARQGVYAYLSTMWYTRYSEFTYGSGFVVNNSSRSFADLSYSYYPCHNISTPSGSQFLAVTALGESTSIRIVPRSGYDIPYQGYKITSVGKLITNEAVTATKQIEIYRTYSFTAGFLDTSLYAQGSIVAN